MAIWVAKQTNKQTNPKKNPTLFYWEGMGNEASRRNAEWSMTQISVLSYVVLNSQAFPKCIGKK